MRISDSGPGYLFAGVPPRRAACGRCLEDSPFEQLAYMQGACMMREHRLIDRSINPHARHAAVHENPTGLNQLTELFSANSRFKVMDDDAFQKDRMISWACYRLDRFPQGLQLLSLRGIDGKATGGKLLVSSEIVYK
jgi:hypothetical protein